jgi:hypothetical protein
MNIKMKKQIKSVSNWSVKGVIGVTVLSAMFFASEAKANNKPSVTLNTEVLSAAEEGKLLGTKIESWMNSHTYWVGASDLDEAIEMKSVNTLNPGSVNNLSGTKENQLSDEAEIVNVIESWMNGSSYWND